MQRARVSQYVAHDIAIDLGTANTLVAIRGKGIVINEPSLVATRGDEIVAVGRKAELMQGRTGRDIVVKRPLIDGVVANFEMAEVMLKFFIDQLHRRFPTLVKRPRIIVGIPSSVTDVERRAVTETTKSAGARRVYLVEEPIAAALGAGIRIRDARGSLIVDIGGGTTEIAVISYGGITATKSLRIAGDELTEVIMRVLRDGVSLQVGVSTAEQVKRKLATVHRDVLPKPLLVKGKDVLTGLPKQQEIRAELFIEPLVKQLRPMLDTIRITLEETPPELLADIVDRGVILTGGGALLHGLGLLLAEELNIDVVVPKNALTTVVEGAMKVLKSRRELASLLVGGTKHE